MRPIALLLTWLLLLPTAAPAGDLDPSAPPHQPASAMYTLDDLYNRLAAGEAGEKRTGAFAGPGAPPVITGRTTDQVMSVMPARDNANAATPDQVRAGKTFWGLKAGGWGLQTGTSQMPYDTSGAPTAPGGGNTALPGDLDPPAAPSNPAGAMFTLTDLYNRLATGEQGAKRTGGFVQPTAPPAGTGHTTDEIMALMPVPDNANAATPGDVIQGRTFWGLKAGAWGLQAGANGTLSAMADTAGPMDENGAPILIDVLANDLNTGSGSGVTLTQVSVPAGQGSAVIENSQVRFDPGTDFDHLAQGAVGQAVITYTIEDGTGATASSTATVTLTGANDGPTARADGFSSPELQVNTTTAGNQADPWVTHLPDGGCMVVWHGQDDATNTYDIHAQRFDAFGVKVDGRFTVNTATASDTTHQINPSVARLSGGGYVVTWLSRVGAGGTYDVYGQRFTVDWAPDGTRFHIDANTGYASNDSPSVTDLADGGFAVVWRTWYSPGQYPGQPIKTHIYARCYKADGTPMTNVLTVSDGQEQDFVDSGPSIAGLTDGGFIVAWDWGHKINSSASELYTRRYTVDGNGQVSGGGWVKHTSSGIHTNASVEGLANGGYILTWQSGNEIKGRHFDGGGTLTALDINTYTTSTQASPDVTALSDGGFVAAWQSHGQDGSNYGIFGQRYGSDATPSGDEFQINIETYHDQEKPSLTPLTGGGFAAVWESEDQDGDGEGVYLRMIPDTPPIETVNDLVVDVLANDADPDTGDVLEIVSAQVVGGKGDVAIEGGQIKFLVNTDFIHMVAGDKQDIEVVYTIRDQYGVTSTSQLIVTVLGANDPPVPVADTASYGHRIEDGDNSASADLMDVLPNDTDPDPGAVLSLVSAQVSQGGGSVVVEGDKIKFIPGTDFDHLFKDQTEQVAITYTIEDEHGATASSTVNLTVVGTDDKLILRADTAQTAEDTPIDIDVLANDINASQGNITVVSAGIQAGGGGSVTIAGNRVRFDPGSDFNHMAQGAAQTVEISYKAEDDNAPGIQPAETATLTITGTNDAPVAVPDAAGSVDDLSTPVRGDTFQISTSTNSQVDPSVATLADGGFVAVWYSDYGIYGQRYGADGNKTGGRVSIMSASSGVNRVYDPFAAALSDGGFVVTWTSVSQAPGSYPDIFGRRYGADGIALGDEFRVNTETAASQYGSAVTGLPDGGFLAVWASDKYYHMGAFGQRYAADGSQVGDEFKINTTSAEPAAGTSVTTLSGGGFVVTWDNDSSIQAYKGQYGQAFDNSGAAAGPEFELTSSPYFVPPVTGLDSGGFVVIWKSGHIYGQRYGADGVSTGDVFQISSPGVDGNAGASSTGLPDGGFVATWASKISGNWDVYGQRFDADGNTVGDIFPVNSDTGGSQSGVSVSALQGGNFVAAWESQGEGASVKSIFGRHFSLPKADEINDLFIDVLSNDTDADDGAHLTVVSAQVIQGGGAVQVSDNQVKFLAGSDFDALAQGQTAEVVVEYTVADQHGAQSTSTVDVTVTGP